jgi:hypothetical protein
MRFSPCAGFNEEFDSEFFKFGYRSRSNGHPALAFNNFGRNSYFHAFASSV